MDNPSFGIKLPIYSVLSIALFFHILSTPVCSGNSAVLCMIKLEDILRMQDQWPQATDRYQKGHLTMPNKHSVKWVFMGDSREVVKRSGVIFSGEKRDHKKI